MAVQPKLSKTAAPSCPTIYNSWYHTSLEPGGFLEKFCAARDDELIFAGNQRMVFSKSPRNRNHPVVFGAKEHKCPFHMGFRKCGSKASATHFGVQAICLGFLWLIFQLKKTNLLPQWLNFKLFL